MQSKKREKCAQQKQKENEMRKSWAIYFGPEKKKFSFLEVNLWS